MQCFPEVVAKKEMIKECILKYLDRVLPLLPQANTVIDLATRSEKDGSYSAEVIELNPWFADTSACLFNWAADKELLYGRLPLEMRIVEKPLSNPMDGIMPCWTEFRQKFRGLPPESEKPTSAPARTTDSEASSGCILN